MKNKITFFEKYHQSTKDMKDVSIPQDQKKWPKKWSVKQYKKYKHAKQVRFHTLNTGEDISYRDTIFSRHSKRKFNKKTVIARNDLAKLLDLSVKEKKNNKRLYPSAGGLYPLELYVLVHTDLQGISKGVYHYEPDNHVLSRVINLDYSEYYPEIINTISKNTKLTFYITATWSRLFQKYGARGYRFALLEAGHVGQLILNATTVLGLDAYSFGGGDDALVENMLCIDGKTESLVYTLHVG